MPRASSSQSCAGCRQKISGRRITCSAEACKKTYDLTCANAERLTLAEVEAWICPECGARQRKTVDSSTPIRTAALREPDNIKQRKESASKPESQEAVATESAPEDVYQALYQEFKEMRQGFDEFKPEVYSRLDAINLALQESGKRMEAIETKQEILERKQIDLESKQVFLEQRNLELEMALNTLESRLSSLNQQCLKNEVEILGIEENKAEKPAHIALVIAAKIGMTLDSSDIEEAHRVGARRSNADPNNKNNSRPLVVRFARKTTRDNFLMEARARRNLNSKDIVEGCPEQKVYVNERLTTENRHLFRAARERANACDFKFCWVKNGCIYVRKREGSPILRIASHSDILSLGEPAPATSP